MPAHYSLYKTPVRKDEEDSQALHARLVDQHVVRMEQLTEEISDACSKYMALKDLTDLLAKGLITRQGGKAHAYYVLK